MKRKLFRQFKITGLLLLLLLALWCFAQQELWIEHLYSGKLFPMFAIIGQTVGNWIPFDVGDCIYSSCILAFLLLFFLILRCLLKKQYPEAGLLFVRSINLALLLSLSFYLFWGLNYFRTPLEKRMALAMDIEEPCELLETTALCIDMANKYRSLLDSNDLRQGDREIFNHAQVLLASNRVLKPYLFIYRPIVKAPLTNMHINYTMVAGYFNPFSQEAQVNTTMPIFSKPFTSCHELGHQAGIGFEDEANLIGFILCTSSNNKLFNYSAYYNAMFILLSQVFLEDRTSYFNLLKLVDKDVLQDAEEENAYWRQFEGVLNHASTKFYDEYLQINNQPEGLKRYSRMTKLLIAWLKDYPMAKAR